MECPVCSRVLSPVKAGGVTVDVCVNGCGGIWLDQFELQRLDDPVESAGELLNEVSESRGSDQSPSAKSSASKRNCPRCRDAVMMRHFFSPRRQVIVDECPQCGGFWLDAGELGAIRREMEEEGQVRQAVEDYLSRIPPGELRSLVASAQRRFGAPGVDE